MTVSPLMPAAALEVVHYPHPVLRQKAAPIVEITEYVRAVAQRMIQLMVIEEGIGLAAPQVGISWRLFVAHVPAVDGRTASPPDGQLPDANLAPVVYINPLLSNYEGVPEPFNEGCLSLPDIRGNVLRPPSVTISAIGVDGRPFTHRGTGLLARCWQHEIDHLNGVLILDKMSQLDRIKNRSKVKSLEKDA